MNALAQPNRSPASLLAQSAPRSSAEGVKRTARVAWLDTLRVLLIAVVIVHHAGQPYGPTGGFWPVSNATHAPVLGTFFGVNASFGMALLFMMSGFWVPHACDRKGPRRFLHDRVLRLGVPLATIALIMFGPAVYVEYSHLARPLAGFPAYFLKTLFGDWHLGHLWFLADLLAYCAAYALSRTVFGHAADDDGTRPLTDAKVIGFTLALAVTDFIVRIRFPIDRWVSVLGILPMEPAHFAQNTSLFFIGVLARRRGWEKTISFRMGLRWFAVAVGAAALCYVLPLYGGGGLNGASLLWSTWEAIICSGFCLGLPVVFRARVHVESAVVRWARPLAYGAYLVHIVPLLALQLSLAHALLPPLVKFAIVSLAGVPISFLLAAAMRKLPGLGALV